MAFPINVVFLIIFVESEKPHIIMISETKLSVSNPSSEYFKVSDYTIFRNDRFSSYRGGGVAILVLSGIPVEVISDVYYHDTETIACMIRYGSRKFLVACIYRPPSSTMDYNNNINATIKKLCEFEKDQVLICGDFNFPRIDWLNHLVDLGFLDNNESVESRFYDICQDVFLHQHAREITRKRGSDEPSLVDLVLSGNELEVENIKYDVPFGMSDHVVLIFYFTLEGFCEVEECQFLKKKISKMIRKLSS